MSESDGIVNLDQFEVQFDVDMTMTKVRKQIDKNQRCTMKLLNGNRFERFDENELKVSDLT